VVGEGRVNDLEEGDEDKGGRWADEEGGVEGREGRSVRRACRIK
jgi:hypothetical protein